MVSLPEHGTPPLPDLVPLDAMAEAAECLRTLAHPVRLRVIELLLHGPRTVGEIAAACDTSPAATSEHLRLLKDRGMLAARRDGRRVYYDVAEGGLAGIIACVRARYGSSGAGASGSVVGVGTAPSGQEHAT